MQKVRVSYLLLSLFLLSQVLGAAAVFQYQSNPARYGYAIFNGSTYVNTPASGLPKAGSARSVFAWIYTASPAGDIYSYGLASNNEMATLYINGNGNLSFNGNSNNAQSSLAVAPSTWQLVGYTYAANSTSITFYLDGKNQTVSLSGGMPLQTSGYAQSVIGKQANCAGPCNNFIGLMSNLRVYGTALNRSMANALYIGGPTLGKESLNGIAAWWPMNWSVLDYGGNGNAGVYYSIAYGNFTTTKPLSLVAMHGGSVSASPSGAVYPAGSLVGIKAVPITGYSFVNWGCTGIACYNGTSANATVKMNDNITETANFKPSVFVLTAMANPSYEGRVAIAANASLYHITTQEANVGYGASVNVSASPNLGYAFVDWSCAGSGCYSGSNPNPTLTLYNNITETANFEKAPVVLSAVSSPAAGGVATGSGTYASGKAITISAVANPNYTFVRWTCTGIGCYSGTNPYPIVNATGNITETAYFTPAQKTSGAGGTPASAYLYYVIGVVVIVIVALILLRKPKPKRRRRHSAHKASPSGRRSASPQSESEGNENPL